MQKIIPTFGKKNSKQATSNVKSSKLKSVQALQKKRKAASPYCGTKRTNIAKGNLPWAPPKKRFIQKKKNMEGRPPARCEPAFQRLPLHGRMQIQHQSVGRLTAYIQTSILWETSSKNASPWMLAFFSKKFSHISPCSHLTLLTSHFIHSSLHPHIPTPYFGYFTQRSLHHSSNVNWFTMWKSVTPKIAFQLPFIIITRTVIT